MGIVSARAFVAALEALDRAACTAFVRDLLAARGDDVEAVGDGVLVATDGSRERVVFVHHPRRFRRSPTPPSAVDVIVTSSATAGRARELAADRDATLVDAGDLHGLALYGLDRGRANEIFLTHLDRPLAVPDRGDERSSKGARTRFASRVADRWDQWNRGEIGGQWVTVGRKETISRRGPVVAASALIVALVVFGAFAGLPGGIAPVSVLSGGGDADGGASGSAEAGAVSVTPAPAATVGPRLEPTNETIRVLPPGLDGSGIVDAEALAYAHERALGNRSYRWMVTYEKRVGGRTVTETREVVTFERPGVYRMDVTQQGDPTGSPTLLTSEPAYADGERRYEPIRVAGSREDVRAMNLSVTEEREFRERAGTYVEWYLSVSRSAITDVTERNGRTRYRIETIGDPYPGAENARASALIDERGIVHELRSERDVPESDTTVVLTFRYAAIGNATVEPPAWYEANGANGSAGTTTGTTATGTDRGTATPRALGTTTNGTDDAGIVTAPGGGTEND